MSLIPKKGTVYVVDDDEAVRDSLQWLLEGKDYRVRCFDSAESFLSRYDPREVACLIVDIRMGGMTGLELQNRLLEHHSPLPIVFISGHGDLEMAVKAIKDGAVDFVQKPYREQQLLDAINEALQRDAQQRRTPLPADGAAPSVALALLSAREREVMQLALQGLPSKLIAKQLCLSHRTVEHHRSRLLEKLGVASMAELMRLNYQQALDGSAAPPR